MIRNVTRYFLILFVLQAVILQKGSASFCNVYLLNTAFTPYGSGPYTGSGTNAGTTFTTAEIPERKK